MKILLLTVKKRGHRNVSKETTNKTPITTKQKSRSLSTKTALSGVRLPV